MSGRKGREKRSSSREKRSSSREKRSSSREKSRSEKERKPEQSSKKRRGTKRNDKPDKTSKSHDHSDDEGIGQSTSRRLGDIGRGVMRTSPLDGTFHEVGREKPRKAIGRDPPLSGFFDLSASTGSREAYAQNSSKETTGDAFAYIREKPATLKSRKREKNDKIPSKIKGGKSDDSDSDRSGKSVCSTENECSGDSESSENSEKSDDSESNSDSDSTGDDSENSVDSKNSKHKSRTKGACGGTRVKKRTHQNNAGKNHRRDQREIPTKILPGELSELSGLSLTPQKYEWQFFDERWITYGQANHAGTQPSGTAFKSDDIEAFYRSSYPEERYMFIKNQNYAYELDFEEMTQINQSTFVKRPIRRNPKQVTNASSSLEFGSGARGDGRPSHGTGHARRLWQFKDESGAWITYGQSSQAGGHGSGTTASSDDIEDFRLRFPDTMMIIQSSLHKYVLDFQKMAQTNLNTSVQREIRSLPFIASNANFPTGGSGQAFGGHNSGGAFREVFVWEFQDDDGSWIPYGRASSAQRTSFATTVTSDDIEQFCNAERGIEPMTISISGSRYLLNFQTLTQTNLTTGNQRKIRRVPPH